MLVFSQLATRVATRTLQLEERRPSGVLLAQPVQRQMGVIPSQGEPAASPAQPLAVQPQLAAHPRLAARSQPAAVNVVSSLSARIRRRPPRSFSVTSTRSTAPPYFRGSTARRT